MKRIVAFYKNGDRYLKEMGSGKSSLYFFFLFVLHSMRKRIIQFIGFWPSFLFVLILVPNLMLGVGHFYHCYKKPLEFSRILKKHGTKSLLILFHAF